MEVVEVLDLFFSLVGCALLGFLAGLFAFRVKSRWCPACGATTNEIAAHIARHARP